MAVSHTKKIKIKNSLLGVFDTFVFFVLVFGIVLFVRLYIANPYTVIGASMAPTFHENDFIVVDKISKNIDRLDRGDIIVFVPEGKTTPYIKRIVGLPGETVKIKEETIWICNYAGEQCHKLEENYLPNGLKTKTKCGLTEFRLDDGYFVLGDNRGFSTDSLCCFGLGCYDGANYQVLNQDIIGKVLIRLYPEFGTDFYG